MTTTEPTVNVALAEVLDGMRVNWKVRGEQTGRIRGKNKKPDIIITEKGTRPVVIETEFLPARSLDDETVARIGDNLREGGAVETAIAIRLPERFKDLEGKKLREKLKTSDDFEYAVYSPSRFPKKGIETGYRMIERKGKDVQQESCRKISLFCAPLLVLQRVDRGMRNARVHGRAACRDAVHNAASIQGLDGAMSQIILHDTARAAAACLL